MAQIVLSDATALIYLAQIPESLSILEGLFGRVTITAIVKEEVLPQKSAPGEREIADAIGRGQIAVIDDRWCEPTFPWLDEGEASTLRAAVNLANSGNQCLVIIDEKDGRTAAAELGSANSAVSSQRPPSSVELENCLPQSCAHRDVGQDQHRNRKSMRTGAAAQKAGRQHEC